MVVAPAVPAFFEPRYEHPDLRLFLNTLFLTAVAAWIAGLTLEGYRLSGRVEMLSAGCGFLSYGSAALIAGIALPSAEVNSAMTVYSLAALAASACHLHAAVRSVRTEPVGASPSGAAAALAYLGAVGVVAAIWAAADADLLSPFLLPGGGSTPLSLVVLSATIAVLAAAAAVLIGRSGRRGTSNLFHCYAAGLLLMAIGLLGVMIAPSDSVIGWLGRTAQWASSLIFLTGFLGAIRTARRKGLHLRQAVSEFHLQSEEHLRALVINSPSAMVSIDEELRVYLWNQGAESLFGYGAAEVVGRCITDLLRPEDASAAAFQDALAQRASRGMELSLRRSDGTVLTVELTAFASGRSTSLILRDVTDRTLADREASARLELLQMVNRCRSGGELARETVAFFQRVSGCRAVGVRLNRDGDYPYAAAEGLPHGIDSADNALRAIEPPGAARSGDSGCAVLECLCGRVIAGSIGSTDGATPGGSFCTARLSRYLSELRQTSAATDLRLRDRCLDQGFESLALIPLRMSGTPIGLIQIADCAPDRLTDHEVARWETLAGYLAVAFARLRSQEDLHASEDRLRAFASASFESIVFSRDGRVVDCNEQLARLTGFPKTELLGKPIEELVAPEDRDAVLHGIRSGLETVITHALLRRDGTTVMVEAHGKGADENGLRCTAVRDITERRAAEQALRTSESLYRAIGESIDYGIWVCDPEGRNTYASESFLKLIGMTQAQCAGMGWSEALHPQDAERTLAAWTECLRTGGRIDVEHRFRGADGTYHPVLTRGVPVRVDSGRITRWAGISLDIGRLKRTELRLEAARSEALREKNRLEAVMETLPVGVAIVNARGGLVRSNSTYESLWGRPRPEVRSVADYDAFRAWWLDTGESVRPEEWAAARALSSGQPVIGQVMRIGRFDGSTAFIMNSASPILSQGGKILGAAVAMLDVSERVEAERRLKGGEDELRRLNAELEERVRDRTLALEDTVTRLQVQIAERRRAQSQLQQLSRVFMDASDPIIIEDLSGTVIDMNREAERAYGYSREELVGKPVRTLFLPERYPLAEQLRARCRRGEEIRNWEAQRRDKSGRTLSLLLAAFPLMDEDGRIISIATIAKDISVRMLMEQELKRSHRRLQELSVRSIEALEADRQTVSRELHDSIGGSLAAIGYALEDVEAKIPGEPGAAVTALRRTLGHLRQTIKESKRISVNLRPLTLDDLGLMSTIDWYIGQFTQNYPHIRVDREVEVTEGEVPEPLKIVIYRVLQEALTNVARHSQANAVRIRLKKGNAIFTLEIADNGGGFDPEALARPGDRLGGMGLKSMQERAAICGGMLTIDSQAGAGTLIRVALPASIGATNVVM
jgi:PAS domain S-box-containing protein